jgi:hypothetical protein
MSIYGVFANDTISNTEDHPEQWKKDDEKDRNQWKLGIVEKVLPGKDGVVRAVRLIRWS